MHISFIFSFKNLPIQNSVYPCFQQFQYPSCAKHPKKVQKTVKTCILAKMCFQMKYYLGFYFSKILFMMSSWILWNFYKRSLGSGLHFTTINEGANATKANSCLRNSSKDCSKRG